MEDEYDFFGERDEGPRLEETYRDRERLCDEHPLLMNTKLQVAGGKGAIGKIQERFLKINASDEEKFAIILQAVYYTYDTVLNLDRDDLWEMLQMIYNVDNIYYKNPVGYLFGYYIVDGKTKRINKTKLDEIKGILKHNPDISEVDVIRYCRLWIKQYEENE